MQFSVEPNWGGKVQISTEIIIGTIPLRQVIICPPSYSSALLDRRPSTPPPPFEAGYTESFGVFVDDIRKFIIMVNARMPLKAWVFFPFKNGRNAFLCYCIIMLKRSKVPLTKRVILTVRVNKALNAVLQISRFPLMVCSHCPTPRPIKKTDTNTDSQCVLWPFYWYLCILV